MSPTWPWARRPCHYIKSYLRHRRIFWKYPTCSGNKWEHDDLKLCYNVLVLNWNRKNTLSRSFRFQCVVLITHWKSWTIEAKWCIFAFGNLTIIIPPLQRSWKGGILVSPCPSVRPSVHLSICPSVDRIVSALCLQQYSSDPFHICTSYHATSKSMPRVKFVSQFKNLKFWQIRPICNFHFVFFWLGIQYDSMTWVIMRRWWYPQNAGVLVVLVGSDNGLSPGRRQAIIRTNDLIMLIGSLGTKFCDILIKILRVSFKKMRMKGSSAKWRPFCLGLNVLS